MNGPSRYRKALILILAALSCAVVAVCIGFVYPTPVANPALGADWQCHRSAGIMTTCHRISHAAPTIHRSILQPADTLQV